jgi:hypothetical protein
MDFHNNAVGREAGRQGTPVDESKLWTLPADQSQYPVQPYYHTSEYPTYADTQSYLDPGGSKAPQGMSDQNVEGASKAYEGSKYSGK